MRNQRLVILLSASLLLVVATVIGCGTLGRDGFLIPVGGSGTEAKFAFVFNGANDGGFTPTISAFAVDPSTGKLTPAPGSPFPSGFTGGGTAFIDADPTSKFVYVPQGTQGGVAVYSVGANGALTEISGSPFVLGVTDRPYAARVHPSGKFLYVTDRANQEIYAATIGTDGKLAVIGSGLPLSGQPYQIIMDPLGRFLYVCVDSEGVLLEGFAINATTGALTATPTVDLPDSSRSGAVDATGKFLIVAERTGDQVAVYSLDQTTGAPTLVGSPIPDSDGPFHVVEATVGSTNYMLANNYFSGNIAVYTFNATSGALTEISGSPFDVGAPDPHFMALDPSGKFLYVVDANSSSPKIVGMTLDSTGKPVAIPGSPFTTGLGQFPTNIVITH